jgi:type IV pilus assembly protein PilY1
VTDLSVSTTPAWKASAKLPAWGSRKILTFNDGLNADGTETAANDARDGVIFSWDNLSPRQKAFLNRNPADGDVADTKGSARLDYIRGDGSNEGTNGEKWRSRTSRLGDFVNSAPVLVKAPSNLKDTDYATYRSAVANRIPMLYVGANDGMLHAFNAEANTDGTAKTNSGKEVFAYVPSAVYPKLNKLPWNDYGHLYYVDATPVVADAKIDSGCTAASDTYKCWRTVLVGGLGAGGQGVYALNVTDSDSLGSASAGDIVMWEFTDRDDADLGYTFSRPFVRKMNNGKWAVIFGNGYNSKADDNDVGSVERKGSGRAFLYVLYLDGPTGDNRTWVKDTDYFKIELKSPDESTTAPEQNGLSSVNGVDSNNDGKIDYLYAGDRRGNLWKVDVSSATPSSWAAAYGTAAAPKPLFVAETGDATSVLQQVTTTPLIGRHPKGGYLILFGTGSYVEQSDVVSPFSTNSFYGVWDKNDGTMSGVVPIARGKLQKQKTLAINGGYTLQSNCKPQYESTAQSPVDDSDTCPSSLQPGVNGGGKVEQQLGWALDLNYQMSGTPTGERYISNSLPTLESDVLTFKTLTTSGDPCDGNGKDHLYNVDYRTGGAYASPVFIELSGTTATTLSVDFGGGFGSMAPSGKVLSTHTGQNPSFIKFTANKGEGTPGTDTIGSKVTFGGCSNFVPGRPCLKDVFNYDIDSQTRVRSAPWGTVGWRQLP